MSVSNEQDVLVMCDVFWGSHGCDLPQHDDGQHVCTSCCMESEDREGHMARHMEQSGEEYGLQPEGCAGTWPYYGRRNMAGRQATLQFFRYSSANGWQFENLPDEFDRLAALHEAATA